MKIHWLCGMKITVSTLSGKQENAHQPRAECQNNPIDLNFHLQKSLEILKKKSTDKIWSNKNIWVKVPCPIPDRVKAQST